MTPFTTPECPGAFRAWLASLPPDAALPEAADLEAYVLWLRTTDPEARIVNVDGDLIYRYHGAEHELPGWVFYWCDTWKREWTAAEGLAAFDAYMQELRFDQENVWDPEREAAENAAEAAAWHARQERVAAEASRDAQALELGRAMLRLEASGQPWLVGYTRGFLSWAVRDMDAEVISRRSTLPEAVAAALAELEAE